MGSIGVLLICLWALFHSSNATCNGNLSACEAPSTTVNGYDDPCAASTVFKSTTVWHTQTDYRTSTCWSTTIDTSISVSTVTKTETTSTSVYLTSIVTVPETTTETKTSISTQSTTIEMTTTVTRTISTSTEITQTATETVMLTATQTITTTAEVTSTATDTSTYSETVTITSGVPLTRTETYTKSFTSTQSCEPSDDTTSTVTVPSISTTTSIASVISTETIVLTVTASTSCLPSDPTRTVTETLTTSSVSTKSITTGVPAVTVTQPATISTTITKTMTVPVRITATVTATATVLRTISGLSIPTNQLTVYATTMVLQVATVVVEFTRISTTSLVDTSISYVTISQSDFPVITSTDLEVLVTCPTRVAIPSSATQAAVPRNYTWGCPPGRICQPRQENCNFEQNDPDPDYRCSPDECVEPPPLSDLGTSDNPTDYSCGRLYKPISGYFNLDPRPFGLGFWIFNVHGQRPRPCPTVAPTSSGWRDWHRKGSTSSTKLQQRQIDTQVPPSCYEPCNYCNIIAQSTGKSEQALCPSTSPFRTNLDLCRKCIKSGKNGAKPDEVPPLVHELQQWIEFCASAAPTIENTAVSAQTGQQATNTEGPSQGNNVTASAVAQSPRTEATSAGVFAGVTNSTSLMAKTSAQEGPISTPVDEEGSPSKDSLTVPDTAQSLEQSQLSSNTSNFPAPTNASANTPPSDGGLAGASSTAAPAVTAGVASPYTGAGSQSCSGTRGFGVFICLAVLSAITL